jgi:hypothetical protein
VSSKRSDLAVFTVAAQDPADSSLFQHFCQLEHVQPAIGDLVAIHGYVDMKTLSNQREGDLG